MLQLTSLQHRTMTEISRNSFLHGNKVLNEKRSERKHNQSQLLKFYINQDFNYDILVLYFRLWSCGKLPWWFNLLE